MMLIWWNVMPQARHKGTWRRSGHSRASSIRANILSSLRSNPRLVIVWGHPVSTASSAEFWQWKQGLSRHPSIVASLIQRCILTGRDFIFHMNRQIGRSEMVDPEGRRLTPSVLAVPIMWHRSNSAKILLTRFWLRRRNQRRQIIGKKGQSRI